MSLRFTFAAIALVLVMGLTVAAMAAQVAPTLAPSTIQEGR